MRRFDGIRSVAAPARVTVVDHEVFLDQTTLQASFSRQFDQANPTDRAEIGVARDVRTAETIRLAGHHRIAP